MNLQLTRLTFYAVLYGYFVGIIDATSFYVTNPQGTSVWQAGQGANVTWRTDGDMPQKITVQLFPATDSDKLARVVAVIADKLSPDVTSVAFVIPENIPAWMYGIRVFDPFNAAAGYSYSPPFWILDKNGQNVTSFEVEPKFPQPESPEQCLDCNKPVGPQKSDSNHVYITGSTSLIAALFPLLF